MQRTISARKLNHLIVGRDGFIGGRENSIGKYFEEFTVGETIYHKASKTIFESDNNFFSLLTMNHHPLHINIDYAANSQQGRIVVVGTLVFSLVVGLSVPDISGKAIANLEYENISHLTPVFINDTIYARSKVLECLPSKSKLDRGIVLVETTGYNQDSVDVIRFRRRALVMRRKT
ncbi:MAG: MaoC family dehydratase [Syntrophaceae bacterium]|nr:MaoC family dehydratase [Syntrophaceae bacterium]